MNCYPKLLWSEVAFDAEAFSAASQKNVSGNSVYFTRSDRELILKVKRTLLNERNRLLREYPPGKIYTSWYDMCEVHRLETLMDPTWFREEAYKLFFLKKGI